MSHPDKAAASQKRHLPASNRNRVPLSEIFSSSFFLFLLLRFGNSRLTKVREPWAKWVWQICKWRSDAAYDESRKGQVILRTFDNAQKFWKDNVARCWCWWWWCRTWAKITFSFDEIVAWLMKFHHPCENSWLKHYSFNVTFMLNYLLLLARLIHSRHKVDVREERSMQVQS